MINNFSLSLSLFLSYILLSSFFSSSINSSSAIQEWQFKRSLILRSPQSLTDPTLFISSPQELSSIQRRRPAYYKIRRYGLNQLMFILNLVSLILPLSLSLSFPPSSLSVFLFDPLSLRSSLLPLFLCVQWFPMRWLEFSSVSNNCLVMRERETWRNHQLLHTHTRRVYVYVLSIPLNVSTHSL